MERNIPMPPAVQKKLEAIDLEVRNLYFKWKFFSQLFTDPYRVSILNAAAGSLFQSIEDSMLSDILLSIMRLTDPPKSMRHENLSFGNLIQEISNGPLRTELSDLAELIKPPGWNCRTSKGKTTVGRRSYPLPGEEGQGEGELKTNFSISFRFPKFPHGRD
jgi:hypothetical protein